MIGVLFLPVGWLRGSSFFYPLEKQWVLINGIPGQPLASSRYDHRLNVNTGWTHHQFTFQAEGSSCPSVNLWSLSRGDQASSDLSSKKKSRVDSTLKPRLFRHKFQCRMSSISGYPNFRKKTHRTKVQYGWQLSEVSIESKRIMFLFGKDASGINLVVAHKFQVGHRESSYTHGAMGQRKEYC